MAKLDILQNAWIAVTDRLKDNNDLRNFFAQFDVHKQTTQINLPYLLLRIGPQIFQPFSTAGININNDVVATYLGSILIQNEDDELVSQEMFKAQEIFMNAFEGTDVTFAQKFQGNFVVTFGEVEVLEGQENTYKSEFDITGNIQPYSGGTL